MIDVNTSLDQLLDTAISTVSEVTSGEKFIVRELFRGFEWNRIGKSNRTKLGGLFYRYVSEHPELSIEPLGKTPQNQQIYVKN